MTLANPDNLLHLGMPWPLVNELSAQVQGAVPSGTGRSIVALNTVGAGTITAAMFIAGIVARGGAQSGAAFTDTTDTAANIIGAITRPIVGQSFTVTYDNNTNATATIASGTGVTISGTTIIPPASFANFLVTYTSAGAVSMAGIEGGPINNLPPSQLTSINVTVGTLAAGVITGAQDVYVISTNATPGTQTTRTATQMVADSGLAPGQSYTARITNTGAGTLTLAAGTGVTLNGTMTVLTNTFRDFVVTVNSTTTMTITSVGTGTYS